LGGRAAGHSGSSSSQPSAFALIRITVTQTLHQVLEQVVVSLWSVCAALQQQQNSSRSSSSTCNTTFKQQKRQQCEQYQCYLRVSRTMLSSSDGVDPVSSLLLAYPTGSILLKDSLAASAHFLLPWITAAAVKQGHKVRKTTAVEI
jgi:hypothetical protein